MPHKVLVPIANGSEEIEAVCIIDTLRRAGADVTVASVEPTRQVICSRGVNLVADNLIGECAGTRYDLIVIPGGMPGAEHLRDSEPLTTLLKEQVHAGRRYAAICAAPVVVLQHHGMLRGRRATCFPSFASQLHNPEAATERVVVDGPCITGCGPGAAIEFTLTLIEHLDGLEKATEVGSRMQAVWERKTEP
ncbi:MAG: DJ-1/PfpI family protein [Anaerolineae bacterium]|nr:DJ-1/PfpI family protein [Anaerolineae bacterium]